MAVEPARDPMAFGVGHQSSIAAAGTDDDHGAVGFGCPVEGDHRLRRRIHAATAIRNARRPQWHADLGRQSDLLGPGRDDCEQAKEQWKAHGTRFPPWIATDNVGVPWDNRTAPGRWWVNGSTGTPAS